MEERANIKNCEALARIQNCTVPENFKYHCVLHELETELVEVCAPQFYIHGTLKMIRRNDMWDSRYFHDMPVKGYIRSFFVKE